MTGERNLLECTSLFLASLQFYDMFLLASFNMLVNHLVHSGHPDLVPGNRRVEIYMYVSISISVSIYVCVSISVSIAVFLSVCI